MRLVNMRPVTLADQTMAKRELRQDGKRHLRPLWRANRGELEKSLNFFKIKKLTFAKNTPKSKMSDTLKTSEKVKSNRRFGINRGRNVEAFNVVVP